MRDPLTKSSNSFTKSTNIFSGKLSLLLNGKQDDPFKKSMQICLVYRKSDNFYFQRTNLLNEFSLELSTLSRRGTQLQESSVLTQKWKLAFKFHNSAMFNPLNANPTKWWNTLKQLIGYSECIWPFCWADA